MKPQHKLIHVVFFLLGIVAILLSLNIAKHLHTPPRPTYFFFILLSIAIYSRRIHAIYKAKKMEERAGSGKLSEQQLSLYQALDSEAMFALVSFFLGIAFITFSLYLLVVV